MSTYLPPNLFHPHELPPTMQAAPPVPEAATIQTVGHYIEAHGLDLVIALPGLRDLPISAVKVEHDSDTQLTYFTQHGTAIGTASWPHEEAA